LAADPALSCTQGRRDHPSWEPGEGRLSHLADILITELSAARFLSGFTGRQRGASAVAFLSPSQGALDGRFLPSPSQDQVSSTALPFTGLPEGEAFRRSKVTRTKFPFLLKKKQTFLD
jgi:hypothetical protein